MANRARIELNKKAVSNELLKNPEIAALCLEIAKQRAAECGPGYEAEENYRIGGKRIVIRYGPETPAAKQDNLENNTLLRSLHR